jgi:ABC-type sugar transport system ATPase subunit
VIEVESLSKRFGRTQAVSGLSFRVEPGTITGFLGPNGAGKSTTLRSILGLVHPDAGTTTVLGVHYRELDRPLHRVGAVLEASEVHPGRSARSHLRVQAAAAGIPAGRVDEVRSSECCSTCSTSTGSPLTCRSAPSTPPRVAGQGAGLVRERAARLRRVDRRDRRVRRRPHPPSRHQLSGTLGRWPRPCARTTSSSSTSTRSPTAATASRG